MIRSLHSVPSRSGRRPRRRLVEYTLRLGIYLGCFFLAFSVVYALLLRWVPVTFTPLEVKTAWAGRSGREIAVDARWRPAERISPQLLRAVIASEDNRFFRHGGFDWQAVREAIDEYRRGGRLRGASTISQQTAKNVFCQPSRSWARKAVESWFTLLIETLWGKRRIAEVYLNVIETAPGVFGAEATARRFFDKEAADLNRFDASLIATVLPSPARMRLDRVSDYMTRRAAVIRRRMAALPAADFDGPLKKH